MSIADAIWGVLALAFAVLVGWFLAGIIMPQSEIDKIDAIGRWAKEELERREQERREEGDTVDAKASYVNLQQNMDTVSSRLALSVYG
jgi:hypothetical protein